MCTASWNKKNVPNELTVRFLLASANKDITVRSFEVRSSCSKSIINKKKKKFFYIFDFSKIILMMMGHY